MRQFIKGITRVIMFCFLFSLTELYGQYNISGDAFTSGTSCYQLTDGNSQSGAVWNTSMIDLSQPFDITLTLNFGSDNGGADGMSFILQPISSGVSSDGSGVGYDGITPSIGVVMDDFENPGDGDISNDHMSLFKNGSVLHGGANELVPIGGVTGFPSNIEDGANHTFRFKWTPGSPNGTIQVWFDGVLSFTYTGDIINTVFGGNPMVYWGVSGSTGGYSNNQSVCMNLVADFSFASACVGQAIPFTDLSISGLPITSYKWDFGDGTIWGPGIGATYKNPTHVYTTPGSYIVKLTVTNSGGLTSTTTAMITVFGPTVTISTPPTSICQGSSITLNGTVVPNPATTLQPLTFTNTTDFAIPDGTVSSGWDGSSGTFVTSNITASGVTAGWSIGSVCLNITHTYDGDLVVYLKSPCGTLIKLLDGNGGGNDNFTNTCFSSSATTAISSGTAPYSGTFTVADVAAAWTTINGCATPNGTWSLLVGDDAGSDTGSLLDWTITFNNPTPVTYTYNWTPINVTNTLSPTVTPAATTTYSLIGVDVNGCRDTAQVLITVNPAPTITCPPALNVAGCNTPIPAGANTPAAFIGLGGATNGTAISYVDGAPSLVGCTETTVRTYTATKSGCTNTCTQNITRTHDVTAPTANAMPPLGPYACYANIPAANINNVIGEADNCGGAVTVTHFSDGPNPGCAGTVVRTYRLTDVCGNFADITQNMIISAPTVVMPAAGGSTVACVSAATAPTPPTVLDNCGRTLTVSAPVISANPACAGVKTYTYTYTSCSGTTYPWVYTYSISAPTVVMPAAGGSTVACASAATAPTPPTVLDNCGRTLTVSAPVISADPACAGVKTYTYTYTSCSGTTYPWVYTYTISAPTVVMPAAGGSTVACVSAATAPTPPTVLDNCGRTLTVSAPVISADPVCAGVKTYTYTYTSCSGTTYPWVYTYTISAPTVVMPAAAGSTVACVSAATAPTPPTVLDNCGRTLTVSAPVISANPPCAGVKTYTYTYTSCSGTTYPWVYTYTISAPTVVMPAAAGSTVACVSAATAPTPPTVLDNCGRTLTVSAPVISADPACAGVKTYTYTYTSCSGTTYSWVYTYTISAPTVVMPAAAGSTVACVSAATAPTPPTVLDNCGRTLTVSAPVISADPACAGVKTYTYTYTSCSGTTYSWVYTYAISAPTVVMPAAGGSTVACVSAATAPTPPTVLDNCGRTLTVSAPVISADPACAGVKTYTYTYTSCSGTTYPWIYTYTISAPTVVMPAAGGSTVACASAATAPTPPSVLDNCGRTLTVSAPVISADPACAGVKTYTYTYTSCSGTTYPWVYTYTISAPTVVMPAAGGSTVACVSAATAPTPPTVLDNCGRTLTVSAPVISADPACAGVKTYTYTYTSCSGTTYPWVYTYTISAPTVVMPAAGGSTIACASAATAPTPPTVLDNCGRTLTVSAPVISADPACAGVKTYTYTYTSCSGTTYSWVYTYTISAPTVVMPAAGGSTVACASAATAPTPPSVLDNCGRTLTVSAPVISADPACAGVKTYTYTYTSCSGTTYSWVYTYTISAPILTISGTIADQAATVMGSCVYQVPNVTGLVSATNNCTATPVLTITQSPAAGTVISANTTVTVTVSDACGNNATTPVNITVPALPTIALTNGPTCATNLLTYDLDVTVSSGTVSATSGTVTNTSGNNWNVANVNVSGNVTVTVTDVNGCTASVVVIAPNCACPPITQPTNPNNPTICVGDPTPALTVDPAAAGYQINWYTVSSGGVAIATNTNTYTSADVAPGTYTYYTELEESISGCFGNRTAVVLTINPNVTSVTNITVCQNALPYTWNGLTFNVAGSQVATLVSATGCDSLATLNLTVNPTVTSTTNIAICPVSLPYSWNGLIFNAAGSQVATLVSATGCDSLATLNLTVNPTVTSTTNISICPASLPYTWNGLTFNATDSQTATLVSATGCDSLATLNLTVNPTVTSTTNISICPASLPYTWNGLAFNATGSQTATLVSATGCDSLATLNLTVNPTVTSTTNITICPASLPYSWNGLTFVAAGSQTATLVSASGCDSLATLNLTVNPTVTSTTNIAICPASLPYSWNGLTFNAAGSQVATMVSATGCDSLATLNLTVNPTVTSTTNISICPISLPYSWNGLIFNTAGSQTATLVSATGCDSLATLNLTVNPTVTSITNISICPVSLPYTWNGLTFVAAGSQVATLVSSTGCDSLATLNLTVNPTVTSTTNISICPASLPYTWNGLTFNATGSQTATLVSATGCDSLATLNLTVNPTVTSTTNITICPASLPYSWNGLTFAAAGSQTATLVSATGCDSLATLNLTVNPTVTSTTNIAICPVSLPYSWNGLTFNVAGSQTTTLVSSSGCDSLATLNLTVNPTVTSTTNISICPASLPYSWNGLTFNAAGSQVATLVSATGCDSLATLNLTVNPTVTSTTNISICPVSLPYSWNGLIFNTAGSQTATLVSATGCDSLATLNLTVNPTVTSTTNISICPVSLPYSWNGLTFVATGSQVATLVSATGCDSLATLNLTVNPTVTSTTNISICPASLPYTWNGLTFNVTGSQTATLVSATGCDSLATLNLTVNPTVTSTTNITICPTSLPYSWNGLTFVAAGSQTATLVSMTGCDSLATLNLTVNPAVTSTTNIAICPASLPYSWNGLTFNAAGSQTTTLVSSSGCDSLATLNLTVNPTVTSTTNISICPVSLPYSWNGLIFNTAGSQTATLVSATGCDSLATLNLTVNPTVTSTTNISICPVSLPYSWNGLTFAAAGSQVATLVSATGCDSLATLNLTVNPTVTSTTNISICPASLPYSWNGLTFNVAGSQTATLVSATGCDSLATLNLTVNPTVTSTTNIAICPASLPYSWNGLTFNAAGSQVATLVSATGCDSLATLTLSVNPTVTSTTNIAICPASLPYNWNGLTFNAAGSQVATLVSATGCDSLATLNLTVNPTVTSTTNIAICPASLPYSWNGLTFVAAGSQTATLVSATGCDSLATLNLTVNPTVTSTTNISICPASLPYSWNGLTFNAAGSQTATVVSATGCDSLATLNLTVNPTVSSITNIAICPVSLPYTWNGLTFVAAGSQVATLVSATGCDSLATLNLTVNPTVTSTTNISICPVSLPYTWNGLTFVAAGSQTATLVSATGCDSLATLNLTVNPTVTSTTNISICPASLPYTWNGLTFGAAGSQTATLVSVTGCDSLATLNLTVNPTVTSTTNISICSASLPYTWNGLTFNAAGSQTATLVSTVGCDSLATLNLTVNSNTTSTTNITVCAPNLPYIWNGLSCVAAGDYNFTTLNYLGCDSVATLHLTVTPGINPTFVILDSICTGATPPILPTTSNNGITGTWSPSVVSNTTTGSYTFTPTAGQCANNVTITVLVRVNAVPTLAQMNVSSNSPICAGSALNLYANGGVGYEWSGPAPYAVTFQNPVRPNATVGMSGTYSVTVTTAAGCSSTAMIPVTIYPIPNPTASNNGPLCAGTSLNLTSTGGISYSWSGPNYSSNVQNPTISPVSTASAGIYTVTVTGTGGCTSTAQTTVVVNALPTATANNNGPLCAGATLNLTSGGGTGYSWTGPSFANATQNPTILNSTTALNGTYTVTVTGTGGCTSTAQTTVTINSIPTPSISGDTVICIGESTTLTANGGATYVWGSTVGGSITVSPNTTTVYQVVATSAQGCTQSASVSVDVSNLIMNAITSISDTCSHSNGSISLNVGSGIGAYTYQWSNSGPNSNSLTHLNTGDYIVTVTDAAGCQLVDTINVGNFPLPMLSIANSTDDHCSMGIGTANVIASGGTGNYYYQWNTVPVQNTANAANLTAGTYTLNVNDEHCSNSITVTIGDIAGPSANADYTTNSMGGIQFEDHSAGAVDWNWDFGDSNSSANQNPTHQYENGGVYTVVLAVVDNFGCVDTTLIHVPINEDVDIWIPNTFTPNGDGVNDDFGPFARRFIQKDYEMAIYDRWGKQLFVSNDYYKRWDGKIDGTLVKANNVFVYVIRIRDINGKLHKFQGRITLLP